MANNGYPKLQELSQKNDLIQSEKDLRTKDKLILELRDLLRIHTESVFTAEEDRALEFRRELDQDLQKITLRQLRKQLGVPTVEDSAPIPDLNKLLQEIPAFLQYLNYYLYFGVRFAANNDHGAIASDCNIEMVGLRNPPFYKDDWFDESNVTTFCEAVEKDSANKKIKGALDFLDDYLPWPKKLFELWLCGLHPASDDQAALYPSVREGLLEWASSRYSIYTNLEAKGEKKKWVEDWKQKRWREGRWSVNNPAAARIAIVDFYWLARILRAEVSAQGSVTYRAHSWLYHLAMQQSLTDAEKSDILRLEEVLRSAFGYTCDLIQNAVDLTDYLADPANPKKLDPEKSWRTVYDVELQELRKQRKDWRYDRGPSSKRSWNAKSNLKDTVGWSRRVWTGEDVDNLVGLAFSGGGIRSATFNLGVLQQLQQLDLLRQVDYLSTVSGGGFIGSWLIGNVRRTRYWLSRMTDWEKSIQYLRSYSDYLAPHDGVLSPDTWTMWGTWIRNAFLIQLTTSIWLAALLISVLVTKPLFEWMGTTPTPAPQISLILCLTLIGWTLFYYLRQLSMDKPEAVDPSRKFPGPIGNVYKWCATRMPLIAAFLAWIGSFVAAGLLWGQASQQNKEAYKPISLSEFFGHWRNWLSVWGELIPAWGGPNVRNFDATSYHDILTRSWRGWPVAVTVAFLAGLVLLAFVSLQKLGSVRRWFAAFLIALAGAGLSYLTLCGLVRLYGQFILSDSGSCPSEVLSNFVYCKYESWFAFAFGPPLAMLAVTLSIVIFIGFIGISAKDWTREWWTRYGSLIAMLGAGALLLTLAAVFAPLWVNQLLRGSWWRSTAVLAWMGSVVSGLIAGNSQRTGSDSGQTSATLEWVAWLGALLFIVGAVAAASTTVYVILCNVFLDGPALYFKNLDDLVGPERSKELVMLGIAIGMAVLGALCSRRFDLNTFGLNQFYRNRLVRCYLGATRWQPGARHPQSFTNFDPKDDIELVNLRWREKEEDYCKEHFRGPLPIINCTLNLGGSSDLALHTRQSASFALTPLHCGASRPKVGYSETRTFDEGGLTLGQAISVSGAAASPNMGYNTSPLVSVLLTLFNVRLGWWFPNPGRKPKGKFQIGVYYLLCELFGLADEEEGFVNLSDGGHFENLGIYELVRRRARVIIAADAECDPGLTFGSLGNLVRVCQTDFGAQIDIDVSSIRKQAKTGISRAHCAVGKITYSNGILGYLIYIKSSVTGDEDVGIEQYRSAHPTFPHESTSDQFFSEDQFEAYRRLGDHNTERTFRDARNSGDPFSIASKLFDLWIPAGFSNEAFLTHARAFDQLWDRFRTDPKLSTLLQELTADVLPSVRPALKTDQPTTEELCACMELLQLMENAFLDLRLDDFWDHPDNRGWALSFTMWAKSAKFRKVWNEVHHTYGIRFEYFCAQHLGLPQSRPIVRV